MIGYHGVGISPDSVSYLAAARNIASRKGIADYNNAPLILFPAGYPIFLSSCLKITSLDILTIAKFINAGLIALLIFIYGFLINNLSFKNKIYKYVILFSLPISFPLLDVFTMLWSETLFILLVPFFILMFYRYLNFPSLKNLLLTAIIVSIACDTRIAGISLIGTGILLIALQYKLTSRKRVIDVLIFVVVSSSLILINIIRNSFLSGSLTGIRQKSETSLFTNIQYVGDTILQWFQVSGNLLGLGLFIGIATMFFLLIRAIFLFYKNQKSLTIEFVLVSFSFFYFGFIILSATISKYEIINNRLLSPAFIPLLLSFSLWLPSFFLVVKTRIFRLSLIVFLSLIIILFEYKQVIYTNSFFDEIKESGVPGYTEIDWNESDIVQYLRKENQLNTHFPFYSNAADAVYFYGNINATNLPETVHTTQLNKYYTSEPNYIVWFTNEFDYKAVIRLETIEKYRRIDTLHTFNDGLILLSKPIK